jgi:hypothetical protein
MADSGGETSGKCNRYLQAGVNIGAMPDQERVPCPILDLANPRQHPRLSSVTSTVSLLIVSPFIERRCKHPFEIKFVVIVSPFLR